MSTFFPPSSPSSIKSRSMGPPSLPSHPKSHSSSSSPFKHATSSSLPSSSSSSSSFKERLMFKKKTPLMASNHTKIKSGYASPSTSSPAKNMATNRKEGRENREGAGARVLPSKGTNQQHLLSPPTSSSSSSATAFLASSSSPRTNTKTSTTKTLLANPRANLSLLTSSAAPLLTLTLPALFLSTPLILGRRLKHPTRVSSSKNFIQTHLQSQDSAIIDPSSATILKHLPLPRHALHASRLHCIVQPLVGLVRVVVLGQNGMKVMGKRVKMGETVVVDVGKGGEVRAEAKDGEEVGFVLRPGRMEGGNDGGLRLDFWGVKVLMPWGEVAQKTAEEEKEAEATAAKLARDERSSSPLTEEEDAEMEGAAASEDEDEDDDQEHNAGSEAEEGHPTKRRAQPFSSLPPSSPPPLDFLSSHHGSSSPDLSLSLFPSSPPPAHARTTLTHPSTPDNKRPHDDVAASSPASSHHSYVFSPPPSPTDHSSTTHDEPSEPLGPIPAGTDLPSLLSSTLVFSHQTSMSLPDLVRAVLEAQPGLRELGREEEWRGWCAGVLDGVEGGGWAVGMFGRIERKGKDASGHPLLDLFFYDPARDPDQIRAKELGGLMRPLRGTQRQGKTYFFKRPSTPGKKRK